jgi:hypothetical protein
MMEDNVVFLTIFLGVVIAGLVIGGYLSRDDSK